nr:MAG TPA: hypothetical protein [Caudoviricetes sp.]
MTWLTRLTHSVDADFTIYRYYIIMSTNVNQILL